MPASTLKVRVQIRSGSSSRDRRSKWALRKFTIGRKSVRWLNTYELIGTLRHWFLPIDSFNMYDVKAFLEHLEFISVRALHNDFID